MRKAIEGHLVSIFTGALSTEIFGKSQFLNIPWYWWFFIGWIFSNLMAWVWSKCLKHFTIKVLNSPLVKPYANRLRTFLNHALT